MSESFYVTLPSNDTSFEDNTISSFKTKLNYKIHLDDDYEVGISNITFTKSWYNLRKDLKIALIPRLNSNNNTPPLYMTAVPKGYYTDIYHIFDKITARLVQLSNNVVNREHIIFKYDNLTRKVIFKWQITAFPTSTVKFDNGLSQILGFQNYTEYSTAADGFFTRVGNQSIDLTGGVHSLFIYSDIVEPSHVGRMMTPLLRTVGVNTFATFGDNHIIDYDSPQYRRVLPREFETIEINIRDGVGDPIEFQFGQVIVTLHFRKWMNTT